MNERCEGENPCAACARGEPESCVEAVALSERIEQAARERAARPSSGAIRRPRPTVAVRQSVLAMLRGEPQPGPQPKLA